MSQYVQMNSIRGLFRAKSSCNSIRNDMLVAFAWVWRIRFGGVPGGEPRVFWYTTILIYDIVSSSLWFWVKLLFDLLQTIFILLEPHLESPKFDSNALIQHWKLPLQGIVVVHICTSAIRNSGGFLFRAQSKIFGARKGLISDEYFSIESRGRFWVCNLHRGAWCIKERGGWCEGSRTHRQFDLPGLPRYWSQLYCHFFRWSSFL